MKQLCYEWHTNDDLGLLPYCMAHAQMWALSPTDLLYCRKIHMDYCSDIECCLIDLANSKHHYMSLDNFEQIVPSDTKSFIFTVRNYMLRDGGIATEVMPYGRDTGFLFIPEASSDGKIRVYGHTQLDVKEVWNKYYA